MSKVALKLRAAQVAKKTPAQTDTPTVLTIARVIQLSRKHRLTLRCAEAVPWRCHHSLIEDAMWVRGVPSEDIMSATLRRQHVLTSFAKVQKTRITYPAVAPPRAVAPRRVTALGSKATRASKSVARTTTRLRRKKRKKSPS